MKDQLDQLNRLARRAGGIDWYKSHDTNLAYVRQVDAEHIAANSPDVTLQLVAITRAALAWNEARRAVTAAYENYEDSGVLAPLNRARAAFDLTETALVAALGAP